MIMVWPDGTKVRGESPTDLLMRVTAEQWPRADGTHYTLQEMKTELSRRANIITGKYIHPHQPDDSFVRELNRVGFWVLVLAEGL